MRKVVTVEAQVDPGLLGGAVAQVGSYLFDGSITGQLRELRRELKRV
jgi:F-type H+-transporting ATPase subunit delta